MCDQIIRDAYDRYLTQKQDKRSRSVLSAQTRNLRVPNPELPDLPGRTGLKQQNIISSLFITLTSITY